MRPTTFGRLPSRRGAAALRRPAQRPTSAQAASAMFAVIAIYLVFLALIVALAHGLPALSGRG